MCRTAHRVTQYLGETVDYNTPGIGFIVIHWEVFVAHKPFGSDSKPRNTSSIATADFSGKGRYPFLQCIPSHMSPCSTTVLTKTLSCPDMTRMEKTPP